MARKVLILLLLARLFNRQVEVFVVTVGAVHNDSTVSVVGFEGSLKVVGVMRRLTTVVAMVACCRVDSIHVMTKDLAVTGVQLCQNSSYLPWQCLFGCSNGRWSAIKLKMSCFQWQF